LKQDKFDTYQSLNVNTSLNRNSNFDLLRFRNLISSHGPKLLS